MIFRLRNGWALVPHYSSSFRSGNGIELADVSLTLCCVPQQSLERFARPGSFDDAFSCSKQAFVCFRKRSSRRAVLVAPRERV